MPTTYKVLGQSNPSATTLTTLYTVPSATNAVISSITIANLAATAATFRIAVRVAGSAISNEEYIAYDITLGASDTTVLTMGVTMNATDVLSVYASSATVAFQAFGSEIS
jgi:ABC-type dipeptide/oligopeptide/nickel transport system permease subunit